MLQVNILHVHTKILQEFSFLRKSRTKCLKHNVNGPIIKEEFLVINSQIFLSRSRRIFGLGTTGPMGTGPLAG